MECIFLFCFLSFFEKQNKMILTFKQERWASLFCHKDPWVANEKLQFALFPSALSMWRTVTHVT